MLFFVVVVVVYRLSSLRHFVIRLFVTTSLLVNFSYSRLPITRTFKGNLKRFELSGVENK